VNAVESPKTSTLTFDDLTVLGVWPFGFASAYAEPNVAVVKMATRTHATVGHLNQPT
jgi:hypothetical protein